MQTRFEFFATVAAAADRLGLPLTTDQAAELLGDAWDHAQAHAGDQDAFNAAMRSAAETLLATLAHMAVMA